MGEKEEEATDLMEKSSKGETIQELPVSFEQVSSKDQETMEKSIEDAVKDERKDNEKEEEAYDLTEKFSEEETKLETSEGEIIDETKDTEKDEEAKHPTEKSSEGEKKQEKPESSEQVSSKDQDTTEKSSEGATKDETKDKEKEEKAKDLNENSSEIAVKTKEIETIGSIDEIADSPVESKDNIESSEQVSECEIKDEIKKIEKDEKAKNLTEKSSEGETKEGTPESSEQVSSRTKIPQKYYQR